MKAIILAAGSGTRMGEYTEDLPKGMLSICGKTIIERQIKLFRNIGLNEILIITGFKSELINYPNVTFFHNPHYAETNMIETLMCARDALDSDILISYSDIIYTTALAKMTMDYPGDIVVAVDEDWRDYWKFRYGTTETDLENLSLSDDGKITELGKSVSSSKGIKYRYIGLMKFSQKGIKEATKLYDKKNSKNEPWKQSGLPFRKGYMTDILNELIISGVEIRPVITHGGWLEFDTPRDLKIASSLLKSGKFD